MIPVVLPESLAADVERLPPRAARLVRSALDRLGRVPDAGTPLRPPLADLRVLHPAPDLTLVYLFDGRSVRVLRLLNDLPGPGPRRGDAVGGVVLAGGRPSDTAPTDRPDDGGRPLARLVDVFLAAGVDSLVLVLGSATAPLKRRLGELLTGSATDRLLVTASPDDDRLARSIRTGLLLLPPGARAVLLGLGNRTRVLPATVERLIDVWRRERPLVVRPCFRSQPGHPVIFDGTLRNELADLSGPGGGRTVIERHASELLELEVDDPGTVQRTSGPGA